MDIKNKVKKIVNKTLDAGEKIVKEGKKKINLFRIEENINDTYYALGKLCYELIIKNDNITENEKVKSFVSQINLLHKQKEAVKEKNFCIKCGYNLDKETNYCPRCGEKVH
ncbi:MAG: hypothetical protein SNJ64_06295 [Endomicrobiia bacterium]